MCIFFYLNAQAQLIDTPVIFPKPQQMQLTGDRFIVSPAATVIVADAAATPMVAVVNNALKQEYGFVLKQAKTATQNCIVLKVSTKQSGKTGAYQLTATNKSITIVGNDTAGLFYGVQTLLQIIDKKPTKREQPTFAYSIPAVEITDEPRFAYRGMHMDVCRHFFTVAEVKKYIDYLAAYKFNTLHWHLTDDQGWRIEIKKYPKLTSVGGWRNGTIIGRYPGTGNDGKKHGGFYTQEQIKEVVKYAAERYITVVPEIEMPGHASAAIAAYPQLSCFPNESTKHPKECAWAGDTTGKQVQQTWGVFEDVFCPSEYTFTFLQDVLDEVLPLFPSKYIHIGGDECPKTAWKRSFFCQNLMKEKGLKNEHELQSYFIQRMEKYLNSKGRNIIGWDEILEGGLAPNATVMSWTGEEGGIKAAQQGHDVIMTPGAYCYFDHSQDKNEDSVTIGGYLPIEMVYNYNPVPAVLNEEQSKHILGAQANVWAEYIGNFPKLQYTIFPRIAAISEVLWTKKEAKSWDDFEKKIPVLFDRLEKKKIHYSKAYYAIVDSILPAPDGNGVVWKLNSKVHNKRFDVFAPRMADMEGFPKIVPSLDIHSVIKSEPNNISVEVPKSGKYLGHLYKRSVDSASFLASIEKTFFFNKATGKKITISNPPSKAYPGTGAFTLVDGIQNEKKLSRSSEFLGWSGKDCEAVIDLGKTDTISKVIVHSLSQEASWIYLPKTIEISTSNDGENYTAQPSFTVPDGQSGNNALQIPVPITTARFIKIKINNYGSIPDGQPGGGNKAWLFIDEIEIW